MFVEIQHGERHVEVLAFGTDIVRRTEATIFLYLEVILGKDRGIVCDHQKSFVSKVEDVFERRVEMDVELIDGHELY